MLLNLVAFPNICVCVCVSFSLKKKNQNDSWAKHYQAGLITSENFGLNRNLKGKPEHTP